MVPLILVHTGYVDVNTHCWLGMKTGQVSAIPFQNKELNKRNRRILSDIFHDKSQISKQIVMPSVERCTLKRRRFSNLLGEQTTTLLKDSDQEISVLWHYRGQQCQAATTYLEEVRTRIYYLHA